MGSICADLHHLADGQQAVRIGRFAHQLEAGNAHALEGIGRTARLECASAQKSAARRLHALGRLEDLFAAFDRARAGHGQHVLAAELHAVAELDDRAFGPEGAAGQLVGRADAVDVQHAGQQLKLAQVEAGRGAHAGQNGLRCAGGPVNIDSGFHHRVDHGVDLLFGGFLLHGYDHCLFPVSGASAPVPWPCIPLCA